MAVSKSKIRADEILRSAVAVQVALYEATGEIETQLSDEQLLNTLLECSKTLNDRVKQWVKQERE